MLELMESLLRLLQLQQCRDAEGIFEPGGRVVWHWKEALLGFALHLKSLLCTGVALVPRSTESPELGGTPKHHPAQGLRCKAKPAAGAVSQEGGLECTEPRCWCGSTLPLVLSAWSLLSPRVLEAAASLV